MARVVISTARPAKTKRHSLDPLRARGKSGPTLRSGDLSALTPVRRSFARIRPRISRSVQRSDFATMLKPMQPPRVPRTEWRTANGERRSQKLRLPQPIWHVERGDVRWTPRRNANAPLALVSKPRSIRQRRSITARYCQLSLRARG